MDIHLDSTTTDFHYRKSSHPFPAYSVNRWLNIDNGLVCPGSRMAPSSRCPRCPDFPDDWIPISPVEGHVHAIVSS